MPCNFVIHCRSPGQTKDNLENLELNLEHQKHPPEEFCKKAPQLYLKKSLWHWCFPVNLSKFLRTSFLQNTSARLLLEQIVSKSPFLIIVLCDFNVTIEGRYQNDITTFEGLRSTL